MQLDAQLRISGTPKTHKAILVSGFAVGMFIALEDIDHSMFEAVSKAIETWHNIDTGDPARIFYEALSKTREKVNSKTKKQKG